MNIFSKIFDCVQNISFWNWTNC